MKQDVCFVIVTYKPELKTLRLLKQCLSGYPVTIEENSDKRNRGYGGAANAAIPGCLAGGASWVVVLNQDLTVTEKAVRHLVSGLGSVAPGIAGPFGGTFDRLRWTAKLGNGENNPDYISGSCMALHRDVIRDIGLLYEPYFMYYEDADYSVRARLRGYPLTRIPGTGIRHQDAGTFSPGSFYHEYYLARNHLLFVERLAPTGVKLHEFLRMPRTLAEAYWGGNIGKLNGIKDFAVRKFGPYGGRS
ncbi:hypothetical protein M1555_02440 [Patescibacteria group bacterium]|nr:hypothetical protein [Patescibacteria group bacterium]